MTRAPLRLDALTAKRGQASRPVIPNGDDEDRKGQTLRLKSAAHRQLKMLAFEQDKPAHDLLIEAVNLLFEHYRKPTIAS